MKSERNEVSYYNEIMAFIKEQIESNFAAWEKPLKVYCKTGDLQKGLKEIVRENNILTPAVLEFASSVPPLSLDIFALITDEVKYELLIIEVKLLHAVGLTQFSQLLGYCIVSNAQYGLLVNVNGGESPRLLNLLANEPDLTYVIRMLSKKDSKVEHSFGIMEWDSDTQNLTYTGYGAIRTIAELCKKLEEKFQGICDP